MFADLIRFILNDWWISFPMLAASVLTVAVIFERALYYNRNQKDVEQLTQRLQRDLEQGNYTQAQYTAGLVGGVIGGVAEDGVRLLASRTADFNTAFDIRMNLGMRKLEKNLSVLGTIGAITPFVGLLGTVVGILRSFQTYAEAGATSNALAKEIGFALIATATGLIIAIIAVVAYNVFNSLAARFDDDLQQIKLLFLSFTGQPTAPVAESLTSPLSAPSLETKPFPKDLL
ncbi:MotA/TolQ/ExbB proton channel family protein [Anthocerotibacter panamensis]|uniref:MotA/TolQ/ExbB proton channel family protein n=1 Tax=Anthocerotibacter panamensis TaxID=2857077 RepID=UPI001C40674A|nr:MotA/TolQ/ExbB proton channel family protein [Anthocerotibacter panamensis]